MTGLILGIALGAAIVAGMARAIWSDPIYPMWTLSRKYGLRRGWRFYRFLIHELAREERMAQYRVIRSGAQDWEALIHVEPITKRTPRGKSR